MIFGYNTDVKSGETVYHVQTEDRGEKNPVIDSVIYVKGRIIDRRRTPYVTSQTPPERLQEMVKAQHRELVDAIRNGTYVPPQAAPDLAATSASAAAHAVAASAPAPPVAAPQPAPLQPAHVEPVHVEAADAEPAPVEAAAPPAAPAPVAVPPDAIAFHLSNAAGIEQDGHLVFLLTVRDSLSGSPVGEALVDAILNPGHPDAVHAHAHTGADGTAEIEFGIPESEEVTVLFRAGAGDAVEYLKFRVTHTVVQ